MSYKEYLGMEIDAMLRHKWIASEKAGRDLGTRALLEWIELHSPAFRAWVRATYGPQPNLPLFETHHGRWAA